MCVARNLPWNTRANMRPFGHRYLMTAGDLCGLSMGILDCSMDVGRRTLRTNRFRKQLDLYPTFVSYSNYLSRAWLTILPQSLGLVCIPVTYCSSSPLILSPRGQNKIVSIVPSIIKYAYINQLSITPIDLFVRLGLVDTVIDVRESILSHHSRKPFCCQTYTIIQLITQMLNSQKKNCKITSMQFTRIFIGQ